MSPGGPGLGHKLLALGLGALLTGCAGLAWHRVFPTGALLGVVTVAALIPTLLVAVWSGGVLRSRPQSLWLAIAGNAGGWLIVASLMLVRQSGVLSAPARAVAGLRDCWHDLLVMAPPAPADPRLLVGVHALVWFAAYATAELIARTHTAVLAVLPGFAALFVAVPFGVGVPGTALPLSAGFLAIAIMLVLVRHGTADGRWATVRTVVRTVPWVACVAGLAALLGPAALVDHNRQPFDPRRLVHPNGLPRTTASPLDQVSSWLSEPDAKLFTVAASAPENWRIAVLDTFDGRTWRTAGQFMDIDTRVPVVLGRVPWQPLHQVVTVHSLAGPWLPAAVSPVEVAGVNVLADPDTGVLLNHTQARSGLRYQVTSQVPLLTHDHVRHVVADSAAGNLLGLPPGLPDAILRAADQAVAGAHSAFEQAQRLETYLRAIARNDANAPPGHTYGHLAHFLTVSHRGTSEQFATAFAIMSRSLGLPSRVVVGFRPGTEVSQGVWQVRGADALAWPELAFAGLGWVPFFPTPASTTSPRERQLADGQSPQRQELDRSLAGAAAAAVRPQPAPPRTATPAPARPTGRPLWWSVGAAIGVAGTGYLLLVLLAPALRIRGRRRLADPGARVAAAWRESTILLRWVGVPHAATLTTAEVAAAAQRRLGPSASAHLAPLALLTDEAAFSGRPLDPASGTAAWAHRDQLSLLVQGSVGRVGTIRCRLSPRALRG